MSTHHHTNLFTQIDHIRDSDFFVRLSIDPVQVFVHFAMAELFLGSHLALLQTNGTLSPARAQKWWEYLQYADEQGTLLISFTTFIIVGAKS